MAKYRYIQICEEDPLLQHECSQTINKELNKLICGRKSVLLKKGADILQGCNIFSACVIEMQASCPLLFEILSTSLGTMDSLEKKIATLATIYLRILPIFLVNIASG